MTPEERNLLDTLFQRLRQAEGQPRDPDAERYIREAVQAQPAAPYYMAQSLLVEQHALAAAQQRIEELERQLKDAQQKAQPQGGVTSFLGGALGLGRREELRPTQPAPQPGPWGGAAQRPGYPAPGAGYSQPPQGGFRSPWGGAPAGYPQGGAFAQPQGGGFMSGALQTAAGVAGGMLAASAISSLLHNSGSPFGAAAASHAQTPSSDTVINNYYGDSQVPDDGVDPAPEVHRADYQPTDADYQPDDSDFGGGGDDENWA